MNGLPAGRPAWLAGGQASRTVSEIVLLLGKFGPQNAQKCYEFKGFPSFWSDFLRRTCRPGQPGRPASASSAGRRSWELVLALTPPSVFLCLLKKKPVHMLSFYCALSMHRVL